MPGTIQAQLNSNETWCKFGLYLRLAPPVTSLHFMVYAHLEIRVRVELLGCKQHIVHRCQVSKQGFDVLKGILGEYIMLLSIPTHVHCEMTPSSLVF
jgi:hypothetical protein